MTSPNPYLGQCFISNQHVVFIYVGQGKYCNSVQHAITDGEDLSLAPILTGSRCRIQEEDS